MYILYYQYYGENPQCHFYNSSAQAKEAAERLKIMGAYLARIFRVEEVID